MKNLFLPIVISLLSLHMYAQQNIGIGTTTPNSKAILDLTSTTKGFLMPRMTYDDRLAISPPPNGLMVYQTNSIVIPPSPSGIYFYHSNSWKRIARADENNGTSGWTISGDDQYHNLAGNVGIGTSSPTSKFHVVGSILQEGSTFAINHSSGILQLRNSGVNKAYVQLSGENLRMGTNAGNSGGGIVFRLDGDEKMVIDSSGDVGIGTTSPASKFHVVGSVLQEGSTYALNHASGILQFRNSGVNKAYVQLSTEDLRLGTNSGNTAGKLILRMAGTDRIWVNNEGEMGFGTQYPAAMITVHDGQDADYDPAVGNGYIMLGPLLDNNLMLDNNEILARNNWGPSTLYVQQDGGLLKIGDGSAATGTKVQINGGEGSSLSGHGYVVLGTPSGANITMDVNEIQARLNGTGSTLYLQRSGGPLRIGGHTTITNNGQALKIDGSTPNIGFYHNGSYKSFIAQGTSNLTIGVNGGKLHLDGTQIAIGEINSNNGMEDYKLTVDGRVICEELKVELSGTWPDYVFTESYQLKPLHELKSFIETNNHLPNIPKASEVAKDGFEVGEMNRKLLEKVEELTLYIIDLQEQINDLKTVRREP